MKTKVNKPGKAKSLSSIKNKKHIKSDKNKKVEHVKKSKNILETQLLENDATSRKINKKKKGDKVKTKERPPKTPSGVDKKKKNSSHQENLDGLKDLDPEFYDFLKKNDKKLLEFNLMDSDDEDDVDDENLNKSQKSVEQNDDDDDDMDDDDEKFHKPSADLEVASDESDFEDDAETAADGSQKITLNLLRQWQVQLDKPSVPIDIVRKVIQAFNSALASISGDPNEMPDATYKVVGSAAFNGVIQLCVLNLQPAILRFLGVKPKSTMPLHKTKKWVKVRGCLRYYLADLIRLIEQVSSTNILSVLLKHLHQMSGMIAPFATLGKTILKRLIVLWSTGDETIRVLAFLCILKITRNQQATMLNHVLKAMYLSYVRNSKFVSPNTLPSINFMRRSLVEMFALDLNVTYQHAFLYIRQLAIHLRNAVILKKKDSFQSIYNWQYVNSLRLWADILAATSNKPQLQPLVYPLVTIATGVIRLIPTAQYFPLRFHCIQALINLAKGTHIFIPVLPLILEVLRSNTFNRKHTAVSMKPIQFTCILRLNKQQLSENGFRDEVIEQVCGLSLEYLAYESSSLAFSDLVVPCVMAIKSYLKECRNANYSRKLKQLLDKVQENVKVVDQERRKITFGLKDLSQVQAWETQLKNKGTPLDIYYSAWVKTHETKKRRQAAHTDNINDDYGLPTFKKHASKNKGVAVKNENGEVELFPSDSEDDEMKLPGAEDSDYDDEAELETKSKKKSKKEKKTKKKDKKIVSQDEVDIPIEEPEGDEEVDIVKDLDLNDW